MNHSLAVVLLGVSLFRKLVSAAPLCWGDSRNGAQCPDAPRDYDWARANFHSNSHAFIAVDNATGSAVCWGAPRLGGTCPTVAIDWNHADLHGNDWAFVAVDREQNIAVCWGDPGAGGRCPQNKDWRNVEIYSTLFAFLAVDRKAGTAFCWGNAAFGGDCPSDTAWDVAEIYSNQFTFIALDRSANKASCWGRSIGKDCPDGVNWANTELYASSRSFVAIDRVNNAAACWGDPSTGGDCPKHKDWRNVEMFTNGAAFVAVDRSNNTAFCWGDERFGGVCPSVKDWRNVRLHHTDWSFLAVDHKTGRSFCWGDKDYGGDCPSFKDWRRLSIYKTGYAFLAVDKNANHAFSWGHPSRGGSLSENCVNWRHAVVKSNHYAFVVLDPLLMKLTAIGLPAPAACVIGRFGDYLLPSVLPVAVIFLLTSLYMCRCRSRPQSRDQGDDAQTMREVALFAAEEGASKPNEQGQRERPMIERLRELSAETSRDRGLAPVPSEGDTAPPPATGGWGFGWCGRRGRAQPDEAADQAASIVAPESTWGSLCGACRRKVTPLPAEQRSIMAPESTSRPSRETTSATRDAPWFDPGTWEPPINEDDKRLQAEEEELLFKEPVSPSIWNSIGNRGKNRDPDGAPRKGLKERCGGCLGGKRGEPKPDQTGKSDNPDNSDSGLRREYSEDDDRDDKFAQEDEDLLAPGSYPRAAPRRAGGPPGYDRDDTACAPCNNFSSGLRSLVQR